MAEAVAETPVFELPFYLVRTGQANKKIFKPRLSQRYADLLDKEKDKSLAEEKPRHANLGIGNIAAVFVDRGMIEDSLWAVTDDEGLLATHDPELAQHALQTARVRNPNAKMDPYSKKLPEATKQSQLIPGPRKYDLKPKNQLRTK